MANYTKAFQVTATGTVFSGRTILRSIVVSSTQKTTGAMGLIRLTTPDAPNTTLFKSEVNAGQNITLDLNEYPILFRTGISVQALSNCTATLICDSLVEATEAPLWSPGDFSATLGWWDASDTSTFTTDVNDKVVNWNNKQNANLWQFGADTTGDTPTSGATTVNELNVFDFNGTDEKLVCAKQQTGLPKSGDLTIITFNVIGTVNNGADSIVSCEDNSGKHFQIDADDAAQFNGAFSQSGMGTGLGHTFTGGPYSGNHIMATDLDAGNDFSRTRFNGTLVGSSSNYSTQFGNTIKFNVMANKVGNRQLAGSFGEMIVASFPNGFADSEDYIEKAEGYLAYKWDVQSLLPSDHPYKLNPPREE